MYVPDGLDPLEEDIRFCSDCVYDEIERLTEIVDRLPKDALGNAILIGDTRYTIDGKQITIWRIGLEYVTSECGFKYEPDALYPTCDEAEKAREE
jgi:hypothetical protein